MRSSIAFIFIALLIGCQSEKASDANWATNSQLTIKAMVAKNSTLKNEFGEKADWVELHNNGDRSIDLSKEKWYLSDDQDQLNKFKLREMVIEPHESIVVWCDDENMVRDQIHTNFKLSSMGETIMLSYRQGKDYLIADQLTYSSPDTEQIAINK